MKMKRLTGFMLAAVLALSLSVPALGADETAAPVSDAYSFVTEEGQEYRVPRIDLDGPGAAAVNAAIWADLYEGYMYDVQYAAESGEWSYIMDIGYTCSVTGDILSILAYVRYDANDLHDYFVYNVSLTDGERLSDRELLQAAGVTREEFNELLRQAVSAEYETFSVSSEMDEFLRTQREVSLSDDIIARAMPYLDQNGTLCAVGFIYPIAGPERYFQCFTLTPAA